MFDKLKSLIDFIVSIDLKLGYRKFCKYAIVAVLILAAFNYKSIIRETIELYNLIAFEEHLKKMQLRDELMILLQPMLRELRGELDANRVLYLEYHNSKENLVGIPFKFADLVMSANKYGTSDVNLIKFKDINSGLITDLYTGLCKEKIIFNKGSKDTYFQSYYSSILMFLQDSNDNAKLHCFVNLSGINTPIGLLIIEWSDEDPNRDWDKIKKICGDFEPRINALVVSKSK